MTGNWSSGRFAAAALCLAILLLVAAPLRAQTVTLQDGQVLRGQFEQKRYLSGLANPVRSSGVFTLVAGRGLIWTTTKPSRPQNSSREESSGAAPTTNAQNFRPNIRCARR